MTLAGLAARNALRNKARLLLTVLGVAVAVMTFVTLRTFLLSWDAAKDFARKDRVVTRHKVTFILPLPRRYVDDVRGARGPDGQKLVRAATFSSWFGGKDPRHDHDFFATMAIDGATYFDVYDEIQIPKEQRAAFDQDRNGAIVGELLAERYGWKIGDRITLESSIYPAPPDRPWTFTISAIYGTTSRAIDRNTLVFHYERLDDALPIAERGTIGIISSRAAEGRSATEVGLALDRMFDDRDVQTLSEDERSFNTGFLGMVSSVLDVIGVLALVILAIMALILANTTGMTVRERTSEYGALQALGFRPRHVALLIIGESAIVALLGAALGIVLAYFFIDRGLGRFIEANLTSFFPFFRVEASTLVLGLGAAVGLGIAAAVIPARNAATLRVTDALRRVA